MTCCRVASAAECLLRATPGTAGGGFIQGRDAADQQDPHAGPHAQRRHHQGRLPLPLLMPPAVSLTDSQHGCPLPCVQLRHPSRHLSTSIAPGESIKHLVPTLHRGPSHSSCMHPYASIDRFCVPDSIFSMLVARMSPLDFGLESLRPESMQMW